MSIFMCKDMSYTYISYMSVSQHVHERTSDLALAPSLTRISSQWIDNSIPVSGSHMSKNLPLCLPAEKHHSCSRNYGDMLIYSRINYFCWRCCEFKKSKSQYLHHEY